MRSPLSLARRVPVREIPAVLAAAGAAVFVEVGLRVTTLPRLARLVGTPLRLDTDAAIAEPASATAAGLRLPPAAIRRLRAVRRVMRHWPFGDTCLRRALVSGQLLRGSHPELRVGVAKIDGKIQAHAWLEIGGTSLDPGGAAAHLPLESVPRPAGDGPSGGER
ncbi:lasso peptide biosynthesis B2 protein [Phytoactinopolyspora halotolerans]|uniref:Lasso peptide biosynthesis B2 protein n=1 Tax=Phytoactinopolyspora halotolerans TaxID=1981512 RepID=A0A6L9S522_9ACTN|nr:lasso peptide biosynthesis B2 protein [Phytoactinopolyspora halotolerans]NED99597.1 lasso peptide biosynthesis B2 protein [Phytoactinopolyspora halotolerans]